MILPSSSSLLTTFLGRCLFHLLRSHQGSSSYEVALLEDQSESYQEADIVSVLFQASSWR